MNSLKAYWLILLLLSGCSYLGPSSPVMTTDIKPKNEAIQNLPLDFGNLKRVVLEPKCLTCHRAHDYLKSEAGFRAWDFEISNRVFVMGDMPPTKKGSLSACERAVLREFIEKGEQRNKTAGELAECAKP